MKQGETFMTIETRPGAKKAKSFLFVEKFSSFSFENFRLDRLMFWQLLDNEKNIQCSESSTKETNPRDSSTGTTTSLARLMSQFDVFLFVSIFRRFFLFSFSSSVPVEAIRDVQCTAEQSRNGSLIHLSERVPKSIRNVK